MITDTQKEEVLLEYYYKGILKKEVRSYEVSLWTLQDEFITVLKWSDVEQKGRIEEPKMVLDVDGTQNFTFKIPMYITEWNKDVDFNPIMIKKENPIWYTTQNGNLIEGMRKVKVIFNKGSSNEDIFEFIIIKVTEKHENDITTCAIESESLAFHELGKIGYKLNLSQANFELNYKDWEETGSWTKYDGTSCNEEPIETLQYWCEEGAHLEPLPNDVNARDARTWYYVVNMDWSSFAFSQNIARDKHKVYEEPFTTAWSTDLTPIQVQEYREKARPVEVSQSNLYNITQNIAEQFGIHCKYQYLYDENNSIITKVIVFYNSYNREEEDGILEFQYPYSSKTVTRNVDVTDLTTKLFISSIDSDNSLDGTITIMNSPANKTKEDYILNFDYIYKKGGINKDQYEAISEYEKEIRVINDELIPLQEELDAFNSKKTELEAKITTYTNSITLDQEQIDYNQKLGNALTVQNGDGDGYISITGASPDQGIIITPEDDLPYVDLTRANKGIDVNTLHVYRKWIPNSQTCDEEVAFNPVTDPNYSDNLIKIEGIQPGENNNRVVYMTYKYKPSLYYDNIIKTWQIKIANDNSNKDECEEELANVENHITTNNNRIAELLTEKRELITSFEHMMGPALREGYWNPENYSNYGEVKKAVVSLSSSVPSNIFTDTEADEVVIGWDDLLFDGEDKIYYETGVNLERVYYPCINLSSIFSSNPNNIREHINEYSFIFNTNYYDPSADLTEARYIRAFAIGSEALLRFVKNPSGQVFPILVLVGAKNMSDGSNGSVDEISFMKAQNSGHPRLGIYNVEIENDVITTSITNPIQVHDSSYWTFGSSLIENCTQVVPRIKFNNTSVKTDETSLYIHYNNILLTAYKDYLILTRITHYGTSEHPIDHPEYYITLRPETLWKYNTYTGTAQINYIVANLSTSIYVDALEVAKNNSEPKVEYNLEANIVDGHILKTLYKELARIIMITDLDLKLEDAFGYISHIELDLDHPENDTIGIKNYKSKFEDLFSTIVAQTEAIQRNSDSFTAAINGNIGLSAAGFEATLANNKDDLVNSLDEYFTTSQTVENMLASLFTEAGTILGNSNKILGTTASLSQQNAKILNNFANQVISELSPVVTRGITKPFNFKVGDIWIKTNNNGEEIGRYVATSDSLHSVNGYGFTRTYDGSLAQITGAHLDIDAANGNILVLARNNIDIKSGNSVYIAANEKIDIVGNKSVNIGGTQINIGSTSINGTNVQGGVNIVATGYGTANFEEAQVSKVLIHPEEIYMAGSKITILTGAANNSTNAIQLDGANGIWIGSNKKISLTTSNNTSATASVELSPAHIFFGMNNISNTNTTAVELTDEYIIMAAGVANSSSAVDNVASIVSNGISTNNSLAGLEIRKNKIAMAIGSGINHSAIIMNDNGLLIGGGANAQGTIGSTVTITGKKVDISTGGDFIVNANDNKFIIKTDATTTTPNLYIANNSVWASATNGIQYSATNGLQIKGTITANALYIYDSTAPAGQQYPNAIDLINAKVTPEQIWLGVVKHTTGNANATIGLSTSLEITDNKFEVKSTGNFIVNAANVVINTNANNDSSIFKIRSDSSLNATNYFDLSKDSSGIITAKIGGWTITGNKLYSGTNNTYVALDANTSDTYAIWCGNTTDTNAPFRVKRNGSVYLNSLMVLDERTRTSTSDNWGNWVIDNTATHENVTTSADGLSQTGYVSIDFSKLNFNSAISLGLSVDGSQLKANANLWGRFHQALSKTASISIDTVTTSGASLAYGAGTANISVSIGDIGTITQNVTVNASAIADSAWQQAVDIVGQGYNGGQTIKVPTGSTGAAGQYASTDFDISNTYNNGYAEGFNAVNSGTITNKIVQQNGANSYIVTLSVQLNNNKYITVQTTVP